MDSVYVNGTRVRLDPSRTLGKGGEAEVYDLGDGRALKVFKAPDHPDYDGQPEAQAGAAQRLAIHQRKLLDFPKGLPPSVMTPQVLATDRSRKIVLGYVMRKVEGAEALLRLSDPAWRRTGAPITRVLQIFRTLRGLVEELHRQHVVIGDFNDLNVLIVATQPYLIDTDSFQFGGYLCPVFTERFVDPLLLEGNSAGLRLQRPHSTASDWYAFAALLMQSLLFVGPYGGIYRPKSSADRLPASQRPLRRITVFHPEVQYPKPAAPLRTLPDDLLQRFHQIFVEDRRGSFPAALLDALSFQRCTSCGLEHARPSCPACAPHASALSGMQVAVRGDVTAKRIFETRGLLVYVAADAGELRWLVHENNELKREDGTVVLRGPLDPGLRFGIQGTTTLIGRPGELIVSKPAAPEEHLAVDARLGREPLFACQGPHRVWASGGQLLVNAPLGPERVGDVLSGQTRFWLGPTFGFGLTQAGRLDLAFTFEPGRRSLNDSVNLPLLPGHLIDAECVFGPTRAWLFLAMRDAGRTVHWCLTILPDGRLEARAEALEGDGSWLGSLQGKCVAGEFLFSATDSGLVRVEVQKGALVETRSFPDTEPFLDSSSTLLVTKQGLCVANHRHITVLRLN